MVPQVSQGPFSSSYSCSATPKTFFCFFRKTVSLLSWLQPHNGNYYVISEKLKMQQILAWSNFKKLQRGSFPTESTKFSIKRDLVGKIVEEFQQTRDFEKALDALAHTIGYDEALDDIGNK